MPVDHTERGFKEAIEDALIAEGGYVKGDPSDFDATLAVDPGTLVGFLKASQPEVWEKLAKIYGHEVESRVVQRIAGEMDQRGTVDCLRHGVRDRGVKISLAFFKPVTSLNPETLRLYEQNVLSVTRQVHYSPKDPAKSIDLMLSVNGLPVATAELKQPFTNQTVHHVMA